MRAGANEHGQRAKRHQRRVGQHLLDVGLPQRHDRGEYRRHAAEQRQDPEPGVRPAKAGVHPRQQIDAPLHHGRAVQIGRNGGRRGHRVGQPEMERHLRRFGEGARQEQQQDRQIPGMLAQHVALAEDIDQLEAARDRAQDDHPRQQDQTARPRHQQRLQRRAAGLGAVGVEADQQVGRDRRHLPEHEERDQVARQHKAQHADHEQHQIGDEARIIGVLAKIARRIQRDRRADPGDQQREGQAQPVQQHRKPDPERGHPFDPAHLRRLGDLGHKAQEIQEQNRRQGDREPARGPPHHPVNLWIIVSHVSNPRRGMHLAAVNNTLSLGKTGVQRRNRTPCERNPTHPAPPLPNGCKPL